MLLREFTYKISSDEKPFFPKRHRKIGFSSIEKANIREWMWLRVCYFSNERTKWMNWEKEREEKKADRMMRVDCVYESVCVFLFAVCWVLLSFYTMFKIYSRFFILSRILFQFYSIFFIFRFFTIKLFTVKIKMKS